MAATRVLVGGLGFGSTLSGVLETVGREAQVLVAEKLETVVWLVRGELSHLASGALDDPRVTLVRCDVRDLIARERDIDAVLLDVDNGPDCGSFPANAKLYDLKSSRSEASTRASSLTVPPRRERWRAPCVR